MNFRTKVSKKQTQILLKEPGWTLDTELTGKVSVYGGMVYHNSDGRTLENLGLDGGTLFKSRAECIKYIEDFQQVFEKAKLESSLSYRIPQGQNFINEVPELINQLAVQLKIPCEDLDKSKSSMNRVEKSVKRIGRNRCLQPEIFAPLVAYVGEVIRQATGGRWALRFSDDEKVWEPWIIDSPGDVHPPFIILLKAFDETPYSIYSAIIWEIEADQHGWIHGREEGWENNNLLKT